MKYLRCWPLGPQSAPDPVLQSLAPELRVVCRSPGQVWSGHQVGQQGGRRETEVSRAGDLHTAGLGEGDLEVVEVMEDT